MDELDALGEPESLEQPCECCAAAVRHFRIRTPEGMPDFYKAYDPQAWFGWSWSESDGALALVAVCGQACLIEWFIDRTLPGA